MEEYAVVFAESKRDRWRLKLVGPLQPGQNIDEGLAVVQSATSYSTELAARSVWENVLDALVLSVGWVSPLGDFGDSC